MGSDDVTSHDPNPYGPRSFGSASRVAVDDGPAPTMLAGGKVPGSDAPMVALRKVMAEPSAYVRTLSLEIPKEPPPPAGMKLASFFCGGGGFDLGFRAAGFDLAFASDYWDGACAAFGSNLGHAPVHADIRDLGPDRLPKPEDGIDVLTGGFPCVTFSIAGGRAGVVDDINGKLYLELCRVIREVRPRYFVAENVKGILSANGGNAVKLVAAAFLRLGYRVDWRMVNMADHGVPQTRERVIFVGVRADQWRGSFRFPAPTHRRKGDKKARQWLPLAVSLRDAVGDLPPPGEVQVGNMHGDAAAKQSRGGVTSGYVNSQPRAADAPAHSQVASGPNALIVASRNDDYANPYRDAGQPSVAVVASEPPEVVVSNHRPNKSAVSPTHSMSKRIALATDPAPTCVAEAPNVQPWMGDGAFLRRMTVRECARVQSFPDWYRFPGSDRDGYRVIGNSVPPLYAKRLAEAFLEYDAREVLK